MDIKWADTPESAEKGVLVASNSFSEWMLPWWWDNYSKHSAYPVAFVDLGMSEGKVDFCKEKGSVVPYPYKEFRSAHQREVDPELIKEWEKIHHPQYLWISRNAWFHKPLAILQTPFKKTLWLDIDCQVLRPIDPLFEMAERDVIALAEEPRGIIKMYRDKGKLKPDEILFNTGVIVTLRNNPLILAWAQNCVTRNREFLGDQDLLSSLIYERKEKIATIPPDYNWRMIDGENKNAVIIHWVGPRGKRYILQESQKFKT